MHLLDKTETRGKKLEQAKLAFLLMRRLKY